MFSVTIPQKQKKGMAMQKRLTKKDRFFNNINLTVDDGVYVGIDVHKTNCHIAIWLNEAIVLTFVTPSDNVAIAQMLSKAVATKHDKRTTNDVVSSFMSCCNKVQTYPLPQANSRRLYAYLMSRRPHTFMKCLEDFQLYTGPLRARTKDDAILEYALPIAQVMETKTVT